MELAHYTLMTVKEVRLAIYIYNHKKFQMPIPNKMTTENNADKGKHPCAQALRGERLWATSFSQGQWNLCGCI